jgi:hypothetical protein
MEDVASTKIKKNSTKAATVSPDKVCSVEPAVPALFAPTAAVKIIGDRLAFLRAKVC